MKTIISFFLIAIAMTGCLQPEKKRSRLMEVRKAEHETSSKPFVNMSRDSLYDKVLGALVGSAIGDAMGAPTEMWSRENIRLEYGYVDSLDNMVREPSPEGTWDYNLPAGGTTDDTRWKVFMSEYVLEHMQNFYREEGPDPHAFARAVVEQYSTELEEIREIKGFDPDPYEMQMMRIAWLQEFAMVARAYNTGDMETYRQAVNKFYGGEMACPGLLYSPAIGIIYPGAPEKAYHAGYLLSIFDIGYAMDITALTAAMVAEAMSPDATAEKVLGVLSAIDPQHYFKSRLLGRITHRIYREALSISDESKNFVPSTGKDEPDDDIGPDSVYRLQQQHAFLLLDNKNQDVPFHAGEIHLINLTALIFTDFNFRKAMAFITNYGRDNDTVAAITGTILGAYHGFHALPEDMRKTVLKTNRELLGIDLEEIAGKLTDTMASRQTAGMN